jgi:acylphosphatase
LARPRASAKGLPLAIAAGLRHISAMSGDEPFTHLRLRIEGFVQSVGYRNFVIAEATRLGVDGWVRNRTDGTVEALVSGPNKNVETLIGLCMKGPPGSTIRNVEMHKAEPAEEKGFRRRPSL